MKLVKFSFVLILLMLLGSFSDLNKLKKVQYIKIKSDNFSNKYYHGVLKSTESTVLSFQTEGQIVFFPYTKGDFVKKGTVIARLDGSLYLIKRNEEQARLQEYFVQKQKQDSYYKRLDLLHKVGAISDNDWESAFYELKAINQQINIQKEKIKYLDEEISQNVLIAPFDSYIDEKFYDVGSYAKIGIPVISLIGSKALQAEVMVDDFLVNKIEVGKIVDISVLNKNIKGKIEHISKSSFSSGGYLVKITLNNFDNNFKEGMRADVDFAVGVNHITLAQDAVLEENGEKYVYKIENIKNDIGYIKKSKIKIGRIINNEIEVLDGIKNGDLVVVKDIFDYSLNQKVRI